MTIKRYHIDFRVTHEMKRKIEKIADADGRSVSNYIEQLIKKDIERFENAEKADQK